MFNEDKNRTVVGSQDLLDYLTNLPNGRFTTICYVSLDNIKKNNKRCRFRRFPKRFR